MGIFFFKVAQIRFYLITEDFLVIKTRSVSVMNLTPELFKSLCKFAM